MRLLILAALANCAYTYNPDVQSVKSVKGGHGQFHYQGGDVSRFFNNNTYQGGSNSVSGGGRPGHVGPIDFEVGVCYIEVPTASLVRDKTHIPAGNGSRPELSRIRTCCEGFVRNVYNFKRCEPVCSPECINGLCIAPNVCACHPDHVLNRAGICVATCPIGCQNGRCDGGECMCKEGFTLDVNGKFCVPNCRHNCGGQGNCTAPNTCTCNPGFKATLDGACRMDCGKCDNGDCVSATECRCRPGFVKDNQGVCAPHCSQNCGPNGRCIAPNVCSASPVSGQDPNQIPVPNQPTPQNPGQNNTFYYNPNQGSNYPLHPYNQNGPQPNPYPNQGSSYPHPNSSHPQPGSIYPQLHPNQPQQGSNYPQPNQNQPQHGSNYPHSNPNQPQQGSNYPQPNQNQPQYGSNYPHSNPNQPQQGSNYPQTNPNQDPNHPQPNPIYYNQGTYPQYPYGQNPQNPPFNQGNPQYPINTFPSQPNQGSYNPMVQTVNFTFPQYPLYPDSQVRPNGTNLANYPGQHGQNPSNQGGNHRNPSYDPYDQQLTYDQTVQSSRCADSCVNGKCNDHNICRCNPGYITDEADPFGNSCRPHCPGGCLNGHCDAPYSCVCNEGYHVDTSVKGPALCVQQRRPLRDVVYKLPGANE